MVRLPVIIHGMIRAWGILVSKASTFPICIRHDRHENKISNIDGIHSSVVQNTLDIAGKSVPAMRKSLIGNNVLSQKRLNSSRIDRGGQFFFS